MSDIPNSLSKYYFQTGYVVKDIAAAEEWFTAVMGVPIWQRSEVELVDQCFYRGNPSDSSMEISVGFAHDVCIELITPRRGESIYTEFLGQGRSGLHHIAFVVPHYDEVVAMFEKRNCEILSQGTLSGGMTRFSYIDCGNDDASIVEILDFAPEVIAVMDDLKQRSKDAVAH